MESLEPWIPPATPDLAALAMAAADEAGVPHLRAWPEARMGGIGFGALPPFLAWKGRDAGGWHLALLQAREVGALVPGARTAPLPAAWLQALDLDSLARPLQRHPAFAGGASVHVLHLRGPGRAQVRTAGVPAPELLREVLARLTGIGAWRFG